MNILFINANLYGHINPTLGLVRKLAEKGHTVCYFCAAEFSKQVMDAGAVWIGYGSGIESFLKNYRPTDRHPFYMLMEYMLSYDEVLLPDILALLRDHPFDMIIADSYFGGACFLKKMVSIPVICSHSSFAMSKTPVPERMLVPGFHPQLDHCLEILDRICSKHHIAAPSIEEVFISRGDRNIVYTSGSFNGDAAVHEPAYLFAGPSLDRAQDISAMDLSKAAGKKQIYISLGSVNTAFENFFRICIQAFRDTDYHVFMSTGNKCPAAELGEIPSNFTAGSFLPQLNILKQADVFITHAGFNSVNEAIWFGVPMLAFPLVNDQHMVASRLVSLGLGISDEMNQLTPDLLKARTETLLTDSKYKENCSRLSLEMRNSADLDRVICSLEEYTAAHKEN
jgi:MGT family glycosyltransferase